MAKRSVAQETHYAKDGKETGGRRTLYQSLHLIPLGKGILLGLLLVIISLPVGNAKQLYGQMREAQLVWDGVHVDGAKVPEAEQLSTEKILAERAGAAANLLVIMERYPQSAVSERNALEKAKAALQRAVTPTEARLANDALQQAMSGAIDALYAQARVTEEDKKLVLSAVGTFNDHGRKLGVRVRDYDRAMQKALDTYNDIPTRALFAKPELYNPN